MKKPLCVRGSALERLENRFYMSGTFRRQKKAKGLHAREQIAHS